MKNIEKVSERFKNDQFAMLNGAVVNEIDNNYARCSLKIEKYHLNVMWSLMVGVPFMLAGFTFAVAIKWQKVSTVSLN